MIASYLWVRIKHFLVFPVALTNGNEMVFNLDGRPTINLEGYLTKRHLNDWHIVCDPTLSLEQQDQAATHICRYLGFR